MSETEWNPPVKRRRTGLVVTLIAGAVLAVLAATALVVPPRTVQAVSVVISPYAQIVAFLGGLAGILLYLRKLILAVGQTAQDSAQDSAQSASHSQAAAKVSGAAAAAANETVEELRRRLGDAQLARQREATRNDQVFAALLESQAESRKLVKWVAQQNLPYRVRELEIFAADRETEEHITGRLRLQEHREDQEITEE